MNDLDCPGTKLPEGTGKSFKGIENFLKRVAFNLGNTPSRTEVKIISCIPIDVSDLQQKILCLEKELEEARCPPSDPCGGNTRVVNTVLIDNKYPGASHTGINCNALDMENGTSPYEINMCANRKSNVSFAFHSEHGSNINASSSHRCMPYSTNDRRYAEIMGHDNDLKTFTVGDVKQYQGRNNMFKKKKKAFRQKKNKNHYVYYAQANTNPYNKYNTTNEVSIHKKTKSPCPKSYIAQLIDKQYKPDIYQGNLTDISNLSSPICRDTLDCNVGYSCESDICSCCHGPYHNIDSQPIVYDNQQVYRAENIGREGRFYDSTFYDVVPVKEKPMKVKKKEIKLKPSVDIMCWPEDVRTKHRTMPAFNPMYLDYNAVLPRTDNYLRKLPKSYNRELLSNNFPRTRYNMGGKQMNMEMSKSSCIDFGDVYPKLVKKRIDRVDRCLHVDKFLTPTQVPRKVDAECLAIITNNSECQTVSSIMDTKDSIQSSDDKTEETLNQIKTILQSVLREVKVSSMSKSTTDEKPKKDATVQKGASQGNVPRDIAGSLQDNLGRPVQTNRSRFLHGSVTRSPDTLSGIGQHIIGDGLQTNLPGNLQGSRLLSSFTYSPYELNPYLPSCSKQINPNPYYFSQSPLKCYQNFPLIVQNQGRPTCASCFRNSTHMKSGYGRQAATIATNTETVKEHSTETEKLIKEIYKSMALTMGAVKNENSSEYEPLRDFSNHIEKSSRPVIEKPAPVKEFKKVTNVVQAVSELFRKRDMQISSESHNLTESKYGSHRATTESRYGSQNTTTNTVTESKQISTAGTTLSTSPTTNTELDMKVRKERVDKYLDQSKPRHSSVEESHMDHMDKQKFYTGTQNKKKQIIEISETSSSESGTDDTFVPSPTKQVIQKERKDKKGLFSKMFKSVFKPRERNSRDKKEVKAETPTTEETSTDSDDYQTVYSQKIDLTPKQRRRVYNLSKRRTHSKLSYRHMYRDKSPEKVVRRSPYMEQEYRRHWNEKLMFQDKQQRYPPEYNYVQRYPGEQSRRVNPYYQAYEARAALVHQPKMISKNDVMYSKRLVAPKQTKNLNNKINTKITSKAVPWLKRHKLGNIRCGEHFRQLIKDN